MMTTINDLNDDCLLEILDKLALREKFAVQRVSAHWQLLTDRLLATTTELTLSNVDLESYHNSDAYYSHEMRGFLQDKFLSAKVERFLSRFADEKVSPDASGLPSRRIRKLTIINGRLTWGTPLRSLEKLSRVFFRHLETIEFVDWPPSGGRDHFKLYSVTMATPAGETLLDAVGLLGGPSLGSGRVDAFYTNPQYATRMAPGILARKIRAVDLNVDRVQTFSQIIVASKDTLRRIRCHVLRDSFEHWVVECFEEVLRQSQLESLDVSFRQTIHHGIRLLTACKRVVRSGLVLTSLRHLSLGGLTLTPVALKTILQVMPNVSTLALTRVAVHFEIGSLSWADKEAKYSALLNAITTLSNLKSLTMEYDTRFDYRPTHLRAGRIEAPKVVWKQTLQEWLTAEKLPKLRRLGCNLFEFDFIFELFCSLAAKKPKESFAFKSYEKAYWDGKPSVQSLARKPRNVCLF